MASKKNGRIYWRNGRAYGDFRDYRDVGGGQEALKPSGAKRATTDPDVAQMLVSERLQELEQRRRNKAILGVEQHAQLGAYAAHHLIEKKRAGKVTDSHLSDLEGRLRKAVEFFGPSRELASIGARDVQQFATWLSKQSNGRGGTFSGGTIRHYLNALSNLYRRAQSEGCVLPGFNPVAAMLDKPVANTEEAQWLEVHEAALLLEAARLHTPRLDREAIPFIYPIIATMLLTGGRKTEVLGLEVEDLNFERKTVTFRPNRWRRLKTETSRRVVPLWPQLEEILRAYLFHSASPRTNGLLFPATRVESGQMITDIRKALDAVAMRAGWARGEIRTKMFRHTYCAARFHTLDGAALLPES